MAIRPCYVLDWYKHVTNRLLTGFINRSIFEARLRNVILEELISDVCAVSE